MKLTSKKMFYGMLGLASVLMILCIASVFVGNKMLAQKTAKLHETRLQNEVIERQKQDVAIAKSNIKKYEELEKIAKQIVPQDKDQARSVREIVRFADESGIGIQSITFPTSTLGQKKAAPAKNSSGSTSTTPAQPQSTITQVTPVKGLNGVYELDIIVQSSPGSTDFGKLLTFLKKLESNRRTAQVSVLNITPDPANRDQLSFTMTLKVYIKP